MSLNSVNTVRFRFFTVFGMVALALWVAIAIALQSAEREAMEKASAEGRNLARSLAEHVASSVRVFDLVLLHLRSEWGDGSPRAFADKVAEQQKFLKEGVVVQISVIRADGRVAYTYLPDPQSMDLSDRQYFKVHKERGTDELYISEPFLGRLSGQWIIQFTRAIYDRKQQFAGVMVLTVPPPALERVYDDIGLGEGASIVLARHDGQILAHSRDLAKAVTVSLAEIPELRQDNASGGETRRKARVDGVERLYRLQKVPAYPLTIIVGQSVATILAPYHAQRTTYLVSGALATALLLALTRLLISRRRDKEQADQYRARVESDLRKSEERLRALFDALPIAIGRADKTLRWTFGNRVYRTWYGTDPTGRTARELVDAQTYAYLEPYAKRALAGENVQFERSFVADDGGIGTFSLRYHPDRDASGAVVGLFVLREDITARKRAGESIRKLNEELERRVQERTAELRAAVEALQAEVQERQLAEASAVGLAERLHRMARHLGEAQEAERRRLAAELHDGVSSNLAAIGLNLVLLQKQLPASDAAAMTRRLSDLIALIDEAKANAKDISVDLRPLLLDERDLTSALQEYARKFQRSTGMAIKVSGADSGRRLPAEEKIALFRIAQEALTNCARHAQAKAVAVELNTEIDHLELSITDDGVGVDLAGAGHNGRGFGLLSMQERAEAIGGSWSIESAPGKGTRVTVRVGAAARA